MSRRPRRYPAAPDGPSFAKADPRVLDPTPDLAPRPGIAGALADSLFGQQPAAEVRRRRRLNRLHEYALASWDAALYVLSFCVAVGAVGGAWWMWQVAAAR